MDGYALVQRTRRGRPSRSVSLRAARHRTHFPRGRQRGSPRAPRCRGGGRGRAPRAGGRERRAGRDPRGRFLGAHIRPRGGDVRAGEPVVEARPRLGRGSDRRARRGRCRAGACSARPRVAVLATGSELARARGGARPGRDLRVEPRDGRSRPRGRWRRGGAASGSTRRDRRPRARARKGLEADVLVTSGGVSVGSHDLVRETAGGSESKRSSGSVAVKPGKAGLVRRPRATLVFGLPGNPVSSPWAPCSSSGPRSSLSRASSIRSPSSKWAARDRLSLARP